MTEATDPANAAGGNSRQLALATLSFAACFAAWGLIGALAPRFREDLACQFLEPCPIGPYIQNVVRHVVSIRQERGGRPRAGP